MEEAASKITFRKFIESINILIKDQEYDNAISRLELHEDTNLSNEKDQEILFLDTILNTIFHNVEMNPPQVLDLLESQKFVLSRHMNNHINIGISNASPPRYTG